VLLERCRVFLFAMGRRHHHHPSGSLRPQRAASACESPRVMENAASGSSAAMPIRKGR
jgi:hypothetical protein